MEEAYKPNYLTVQDIYAKDIFFEFDVSNTDVTIHGSLKSSFNYGFIDFTYACEFKVLVDILTIMDDEKSDIILESITKQLENPDPIGPGIVNIEGKFGEPILLEDQRFKIYKPQERNALNNWNEVKDDIYIIESVEWAPNWFPRTNTSWVNCPDNFKVELDQYMKILNLSFIYYKRLIELGISDKNARRRTGLKDELLYRIAYLKNKEYMFD